MHEQRAEPDDAARGNLERNHSLDVELVAIHLVCAETVDLLTLAQAFTVAPGYHLETAVFDGRVVQEEDCRADVMRVLGDTDPVWKILMQDDRSAVLGALHVQLFREELDRLEADHVLHRI